MLEVEKITEHPCVPLVRPLAVFLDLKRALFSKRTLNIIFCLISNEVELIINTFLATVLMIKFLFLLSYWLFPSFPFPERWSWWHINSEVCVHTLGGWKCQTDDQRKDKYAQVHRWKGVPRILVTLHFVGDHVPSQNLRCINKAKAAHRTGALKMISSPYCAVSENPNVYKHYKRLTRWNANRCYSLKITYLIFETFQILFQTASLIFTAVKVFIKQYIRKNEA